MLLEHYNSAFDRDEYEKQRNVIEDKTAKILTGHGYLAWS